MTVRSDCARALERGKGFGAARGQCGRRRDGG